jgi:hypothetical protein
LKGVMMTISSLRVARAQNASSKWGGFVEHER